MTDENTARRWLRERDQARDEGDALARAVADHLEGRQVDLRKALERYIERGPVTWGTPG